MLIQFFFSFLLTILEMSAASESKYSTEVLSELLAKLQVADNKDDAAASLSSFLNSSIVEHDAPVEFFQDLKKQISNKATAIGALQASLQTHCLCQRFVSIH